MKRTYVILIFILVLFIIILLSNHNEYFIDDNNTTDNKSSSLERIKVKQGTDVLEGTAFDDVILIKGEHTIDGELGLEKCIKNCPGMCVEYGMTGDAFCFPKVDFVKTFEKTEKELDKVSPTRY